MNMDTQELRHDTGDGALIKFIVLLLLAAGALAVGLYLQRDVPKPADALAGISQLEKDQTFAHKRFMVDLSLHNASEIEAFLKHAEKLSSRLEGNSDYPGIALVLHGPEIEYFARKNYDKYKTIVDLAARLDAGNVIDVKACQTMMKFLHVEKDEMPDFIEQVPYGPNEMKRLEIEGYTYL